MVAGNRQALGLWTCGITWQPVDVEPLPKCVAGEKNQRWVSEAKQSSIAAVSLNSDLSTIPQRMIAERMIAERMIAQRRIA